MEETIISVLEENCLPWSDKENKIITSNGVAELGLKSVPSAQSESTRTFVELFVEYPDPELCAYKEYKGKPYYSIKYIENGEKYVGYGTYNPEVLSQYLKEYFISSAQPEITPCGDCKHHHRDGQGLQYCDRIDYGYGWKDEDFCSRAERRTD